MNGMTVPSSRPLSTKQSVRTRLRSRTATVRMCRGPSGMLMPRLPLHRSTRARSSRPTMTTVAVTRMRRSCGVGAGTRPCHQVRVGAAAGRNTDHEAPRLVVFHWACEVLRAPLHRFSTETRMRRHAGAATRAHHVSREARCPPGPACAPPGTRRSMSTRPHEGHRSEPHGMTARQNGHGRYPLGMSPPVRSVHDCS